jgi:hypothetical protein
MRRDLGALAAPPWLGDGRISAHAGFFMLVNAWQVVGFHDWIDAQPPHGRAAIARAWLERWARRLRLPVDDVQRAAWTAPAEEPLPADACAALATWMSGTRRWLRAQAHVGPASLVLRDGLVSVTRTHVDVTFGLDDIDLRARRAGLDKDPGWVPWLGRIVAFHFLEDRRGDSAR